MARASNRLTAVAIKNATRPGMYSDGHNLYMRVGPTGAKSWVFRYRRNGKLRDHGIGALHTVGLARARAKALKLRVALVEDDRDPIEERRAQRRAKELVAAKVLTFRQCAEAYIAAHQAGWRSPVHARQWPATLETYVFPVFGALPVASIDTALVMRALEPVWTTRTETASRVRGRIEAVLDWATARGYRAGENPARWRGHLENLLPKRSKVQRVQHFAALPYPEMPEFMIALRQQEGTAARAVEFTVLTAARAGEVLGARWSEFNLAERLWTIPGERMKSGKEHRVPLSNAALVIVEQMAARREGDLVFPGQREGRPLSATATTAVLQRIGHGHVVLHGFRSTFSDWCAERTNYPSEVREMALAHTVGDKVEAAYRRGDLFQKRRQLAEAWARYCAAPAPQGEVLPLRRQR